MNAAPTSRSLRIASRVMKPVWPIMKSRLSLKVAPVEAPHFAIGADAVEDDKVAALDVNFQPYPAATQPATRIAIMSV